MSQTFKTSSKNLVLRNRYEYTDSQLLGKGATGIVYKGFDKSQNKYIAIKVIETGKMNNVERALVDNQKRALQLIKNKNVIETKEIFQENGTTYIITELLDGGTLKDYLQKNGRFKEKDGMEMFRKIVSGYCAVVQANIIHRDLKTANIMLTKSNEPSIIDFGYSQIIIANKNLTVFNVGSPSYMSPQAYKKTIFSEKSDVWSLGAIFYEILTNTTLDEGIPLNHYFKRLEELQHPVLCFEIFGEITQQILKGCLSTKPQNRITAHKIKYLLDKQIIGKQLSSRPVLSKQSSQNSNSKIVVDQKDKSFKPLNILLKDLDFKKLRSNQSNGDLKRAPHPKTYSNLTSSQNIYDLRNQLPPRPSKNTSTNLAIDSKSPSISRLQLVKNPSTTFKSFQTESKSGQMNSMSSISYVDKNVNKYHKVNQGDQLRRTISNTSAIKTGNEGQQKSYIQNSTRLPASHTYTNYYPRAQKPAQTYQNSSHYQPHSFYSNQTTERSLRQNKTFNMAQNVPQNMSWKPRQEFGKEHNKITGSASGSFTNEGHRSTNDLLKKYLPNQFSGQRDQFHKEEPTTRQYHLSMKSEKPFQTTSRYGPSNQQNKFSTINDLERGKIYTNLVNSSQNLYQPNSFYQLNSTPNYQNKGWQMKKELSVKRFI